MNLKEKGEHIGRKAITEFEMLRRKGLGRTLRQATNEVGTAITDGVRELHADIERRGGVGQIAKETWDEFKDLKEDAVSAYRKHLTTNGQYDPEKLDRILSDALDKTASLPDPLITKGREFYQTTLDAIRTNVDRGKAWVEEERARVFLTEEELAMPAYRDVGRIAVEGQERRATMTRLDYMANEQLIKEAAERIPAGTWGRQKIREDITYTGARTWDELGEFYETHPAFTLHPHIAKDTKRKLRVLDAYR